MFVKGLKSEMSDPNELKSTLEDVVGGTNENLYLEDPVKTLSEWFEQNRCEVKYEVTNLACKLKLPIETSSGVAIKAEASIVDCLVEEARKRCALDACHQLNSLGLLFQSTEVVIPRAVKLSSLPLNLSNEGGLSDEKPQLGASGYSSTSLNSPNYSTPAACQTPGSGASGRYTGSHSSAKRLFSDELDSEPMMTDAKKIRLSTDSSSPVGPKHSSPLSGRHDSAFSSFSEDKSCIFIDSPIKSFYLSPPKQRIIRSWSISDNPVNPRVNVRRIIESWMDDDDPINLFTADSGKAFVRRVREALRPNLGGPTYGDFAETLMQFKEDLGGKVSRPDSLSRIANILGQHVDLYRQLILSLGPDVALFCGKEFEFFLYDKMGPFFAGLKVKFRKDPDLLGRILQAVQRVAMEDSPTIGELRDAVQTLLGAGDRLDFLDLFTAKSVGRIYSYKVSDQWRQAIPTAMAKRRRR